MKKKKLLFLISVFIIIFSFSIKAEFTYEYRNVSLSPVNNVFLMIYKCGDSCVPNPSDLVVEANSGGENNISFSVPQGEHFIEYHATENCYRPRVREYGEYLDGLIKGLSFLKVSPCVAPISNFSTTEPISVNRDAKIKVRISSPLVDEYQQFGGKNMFVPEKLKRFFETDVTVQLLINNNIANSTEIAVPLSGKEVKFVYKFLQEGSYDITIKTIPTDCKCKSADETEVTLSVNVQAPQKTCSDGTPINACSNKTRGMFCNENQELVWNCQVCGCPQGQECQPDGKCKEVIIVEQRCQEHWERYVGDCINGTREVTYVDISGCCGNPPCIANKTYEPCEEEPQPQLQQENGTNGSQLPGIYPTKSWLEENGLYFVLAIIILVLLIGFTIYFLETHKPKILEKPKEKPEKKKKKEELIPVKVNDLLLSVIDSLEDDEQAICNVLLEGEGIRQNDLRLKLGMPKQKFEIAMQKLERRQIIKEREGPNPRIFFNDWLK